MVGMVRPEKGQGNLQAGFTLVETLVAMGLLAVLAIGATDLIINVKKGQQQVSNKDVALQFQQSIGQFLQGSTCTPGLAGTNYPAGGTVSNLTITGYKGYGQNPAIPNLSATPAAPFTVTDQVVATGLTIQDSGIPPQNVPDPLSPGINFQQYVAKISLSLQQQVAGIGLYPKGTWLPIPPQIYQIPVTVSGGVIKSCSSSTSLADTCAAMGGVLGAGGQCTYGAGADQCQFKGSYATATCVPYPVSNPCAGGSTNQFTGGYNCPAGSIASQTGETVQSFTDSCGKKCTQTVNDTIDFYVCMQCPSGAGAGGGGAGGGGLGGGGLGGGGGIGRIGGRPLPP